MNPKCDLQIEAKEGLCFKRVAVSPFRVARVFAPLEPQMCLFEAKTGFLHKVRVVCVIGFHHGDRHLLRPEPPEPRAAAGIRRQPGALHGPHQISNHIQFRSLSSKSTSRPFRAISIGRGDLRFFWQVQELLGGDALDKQLYVEHWCASPPQTFTPMPAGAVALHSLLGDLICAKKGGVLFCFSGSKKEESILYVAGSQIAPRFYMRRWTWRRG